MVKKRILRNGKAILSIITMTLLTISQAQAEIPPRPEKYNVPFYAPDKFIKHAELFKEEMIQIGDHPIYDYNTPGSGKPNSGFGNIIVVEGEKSLVVIDTSVSNDNAAQVLKDIRSRTDKPVEALIYTHHHADHIAGATTFVGDNKNIKIIAAENFMKEMVAENQATGPIMALRASYMYGNALPPDAEGKYYHVGCCGFHAGGTNGFVEPNTLIPLDKDKTMMLAGEKFVFFATGGEAASHLAVYMPERKVMFTGDELQGPTFPQLHSLRGTKPRDIIKWVSAIDKMRAYEAEHLVPSHGQPMSGKQQINAMLTTYRDAMQYVHDHTVRLINMGYTPDEIGETMTQLPPELQMEPWTTEYYGNVDVSARNIYGGYISWWSGDPAELRPTPRLEKAKRMIRLMGGRDKVFAEAESAFFENDVQWASELTTYLIRIDQNDWDARYLKAAALRTQGYQETSSSTKGFYLTGALELEGKVQPALLQQQLFKMLFNAENTSTPLLFESLRYTINPQRAQGKTITLGYQFTDTKEEFTLMLRNGILEIVSTLPKKADATITMSRDFGNKILRHEESLDSGIKAGTIKVKGQRSKIDEFFAVMDRPDEKPAPNMVLR